ncbi:PIN domain-containing protein [Leptothrix discophora]|uniref:PIN domain-containing protein n=1 Tax=Leptothrix discophora TaxID=89 RepID=A0ABT9G0Z0_LEPDI|nr:PIN domain-containing protein [Leptothrix discophora]MDP4300151.1 PIN domain-containing protein [Leptothrix discophora]
MNTATSPVAPVPVVIDTNVVLDWLVFRSDDTLALGAAVMSGRLAWLATEAMREESIEVLDRLRTHAHLQRWDERRAGALEAVARWMQPVESPPPLPWPMRLRSVDPDDQVFIDLALHRRIPWLLSRDRALLKLAKRARPHGVQVVTPAQWNVAWPASLQPALPTPLPG